MTATLEQPKAKKTEDLLPKPFGPYVMLGGRHVDHVGVKRVKIAKVEAGVIETECGLSLPSGRQGVEVSFDGQGCRMYSTRTGLQVNVGELRPGHEVILAAKREIRINPVTKRSEPFYAGSDLQERHNSPGSTKFIMAEDKTENATLRGRIADLEAQLAAAKAEDKVEGKRR